MSGSPGQVLRLRPKALGALRRDLIHALGTERAKGFLLRFGWALGHEDATALRAEPGLTDLDWIQAGPRLHGESRMAAVQTDLLRIDRQRVEFRMEGRWEGSYEAREHLRHFGPAQDPVCWTLVGYAGGFATAVMGRRVLFREMACVARGDDSCRFVGMPESDWGLQAQAELPLYELEPLAEETDAAHRRIRRLNDQLQHVLGVHDQLTHVVMRGAGLNDIAEALSRLLGCSVAIEDRCLGPLALSGPGSDQHAPGALPTLAAIVERRPDLRRQFLRLEHDRQPLLLPAPAGDRWGDLVVAPILLSEQLFGFLTMTVVEGLSADLMRMVAERAALACGLAVLRDRTEAEVEQRVRGDFIEHLLAPGGDPAFLERWAHHLGLALGDRPHRLFLLQPAGCTADGRGLAPSERARLHGRLQELLDSRGVRGFGSSHGEGLVGLIECSAVLARELAEALQARASEEWLPVWVGVSRPFQGVAEARAAYEECRTLLSAWRASHPCGRVVLADEMDALQRLFLHGNRAEAIAYAQNRLGPLLRYDDAHQGGLLPTLSLFLENAGNLQATAQRLNISVSGLKYRLQRIREVGGLDLDDAEVRLDLMVALRILSLTGEYTPADSGRNHRRFPSDSTVHKSAPPP